jgi:hypothetical protein
MPHKSAPAPDNGMRKVVGTFSGTFSKSGWHLVVGTFRKVVGTFSVRRCTSLNKAHKTLSLRATFGDEKVAAGLSARGWMMEIVSQGSVRVGRVVWRPAHGHLAFTVVCKATFELSPGVSPLADVQEPIFEADAWTTSGTSLRLTTDLVPFKQRPEVLVVGHAHAPRGQAVASLVARLVVGEVDKSILVVGDREISPDGRLGEPTPFVQMPLVWERAAGGPNTDNPAGKPMNGLGTASSRASAPNLYSLNAPSVGGQSTFIPIGFAPIAPQWPSRLACLRRHTHHWDVSRWYERALPADIDLAFLNAAPSDQQRATPFGSEDSIYLENLHPELPRLSTRLAPFVPQATVYRASGTEQLKLRCDTLTIDTDRGLAMLVWRAHVLVDETGQAARVVVSGPGSNNNDAPPPPVQDSSDSEEMTLPPVMRKAMTVPFVKGVQSPLAVPAPKNVSSEAKAPAPSSDGEETSYLSPGTVPRTSLPFAQGVQSPLAVAAPNNVASEIKVPAAPSNDGEETSYISPGTAPRAALPFLDTPREMGPAIAAIPAPSSSPPTPMMNMAAWASPLPSISEPNPGPALAPASLAVTAPAPSAEIASKTDVTELRLREIQRAIWKGDRPLKTILDENGLTEFEWRAMKRRFARRQDA